ncbi:MAG: MSMEG_0565 family glycosyltransferase, partial [Actinomycetota bacterium]|nr:MSMEG_0565 family glycosyltransferase [Actinomycetota bacterium]
GRGRAGAAPAVAGRRAAVTVTPAVAFVTYSIKPRGGVVHTLAVAEALGALGTAVEVIALAEPGQGFYRDVTVPWRTVEAPPPASTLEERVFNSVDALAAGLEAMGDSLPPILHTQDCISARAACRVRDRGRPTTVVRTVHHVDDFSTPALIDCQRRAIYEPDRVLVVSRTWQRIMCEDYGIQADIVPNGVDLARFGASPDPAVLAGLRARVGATGRFLCLTVGGLEPRKGSDVLMRALATTAEMAGVAPVLVVVGGHSFQDHRAYRQAVLDSLPGLGLELGRDVVLLGTVPDQELPAWYHAADAFVFPSVTEGWGLVVMEAMAAGLPVVATAIPVFEEYLTSGVDALLSAPGDDHGLATSLSTLMGDASVGRRLAAGGRAVAKRFGWDASARNHLEVYRHIAAETLRVDPK